MTGGSTPARGWMMHDECRYTRKHLARYLNGRLFKLQQLRVRRHLKSCQLCRSQYDALSRIEETQLFLRELAPPEGIGRVLRPFIAVGSALRKLFYRPLWAAAIAVAVALLYLNVLQPVLHDPELEKLDAGQTTSPSAATTTAAPASAPAATVPAAEQKQQAQQEAGSATDPLVVTITVDQETEKASVKRINNAMKEHALLRTMRFSDRTREISGSLTANELYTFFNKIQGVGKINCKHSRLSSVEGSELVPFVLKLQTAAAKPSAKPVQKRAADTVEKPVQHPADTPPETPADKPAARPADQPASGPAPATP